MCCHIPSQRSVKLYQSILQPNAQEYSGLQGSLYQSTWSPVCCGYHARISLTQELVPSFDYLLKTLTISVRYLTPRQNKDPSDMFTCTLIYQTQVISIIEVHTAKEFNPTAILHLLPFASLYPLLPVIHETMTWIYLYGSKWRRVSKVSTMQVPNSFAVKWRVMHYDSPRLSWNAK